MAINYDVVFIWKILYASQSVIKITNEENKRVTITFL